MPLSGIRDVDLHEGFLCRCVLSYYYIKYIKSSNIIKSPIQNISLSPGM